jgi:hypothetical protein
MRLSGFGTAGMPRPSREWPPGGPPSPRAAETPGGGAGGRGTPYAFVQELGITMRVYRVISSEVGSAVPLGLIIQAAGVRHGGTTVRLLEVWESRGHCERFRAERFRPTLWRVLRELGLPPFEAEGPVEEIDAPIIWRP